MYPRVYFPDLTTSASLVEMDSLDLVALDFFVGAMACCSVVDCLFLQSRNDLMSLYSSNDQGSSSEYHNHMTITY